MDFNSNKPKKELETRINEWIRVPEVLVIDQKGNNLGKMSTTEAVRLAKEAELDLVEVGATSQPPVCRIMDYSKYVYEQNKKMRKNKAGKAKDLKEFRFSTVIDEGDKNTRIRRAHEFLQKDHPVRITVQRKGRQTREQALAVFNDILTNFTEYSTIEPEPKSEGNRITITFKKNGTSKNKQNSSEENKAIESQGE
ncbi:translation initiation factor IF-3 [Candidatus Dojkabacteria bacterium HGW-Dojkabacteria-1]|uniref:Translation initiation factor IF-3 n=1 Tax=Candidatus Dojkabacteria bacterium HGW-Dojkabacteria-1 TaxID=2013761 RepID=A0A2N2F3Y4_9BACT|nr:MAG: translation initiation factor IF-3 [Candidatus Dojkabacteria bacterium HGW-Dojkabacteria-1]